jgi:hypothetical protein
MDDIGDEGSNPGGTPGNQDPQPRGLASICGRPLPLRARGAHFAECNRRWTCPSELQGTRDGIRLSLRDRSWSKSLSCVFPAMRSDDVTPRRLPRPMLAAVVVLWYAALVGLNAAFGDPGRVSFPGIAVFYGLWTLPGLAIPLRTAFRSGVLEALVLPLGTAAGISALAFASSGLLSCRPGARQEFGLVLVWGTLACAAWSAGWISFRTNRPGRLAGQVGVACAALLGLLLFFADHCDFGTAAHGALATFFWPALVMFTYPAALVGALVGALADAARRRRRSRNPPPRPDR